MCLSGIQYHINFFKTATSSNIQILNSVWFNLQYVEWFLNQTYLSKHLWVIKDMKTKQNGEKCKNV